MQGRCEPWKEEAPPVKADALAPFTCRCLIKQLERKRDLKPLAKSYLQGGEGESKFGL